MVLERKNKKNTSNCLSKYALQKLLALFGPVSNVAEIGSVNKNPQRNEINIRIVQKYLITTVYIEDKQSPFHPKILYHYSIKNELNSAVNKALAIIIINC